MSDGGLGSISFFQKNETVCPVCEHKFRKEDLRVGGGRLIAGNLGNDLRRYYEASKKFGDVYPLIYYVMTCPGCFYSSLSSDFLSPDPKSIEALRMDERARRQAVDLIFPDLDWDNLKTLKEGAAGYFLAIMCYQHATPAQSPTIKSGICSLRGAWCFADLHKRFPTENFDYLEKIFFHKARFFYSLALDRETSGEESVNAGMNFGPDVDNNFGFDGAMYLAGYLEYHFGSQADGLQREQSLAVARRAIARLVGMGKSSKSKPGPLIEKAKDLHHLIGEEIKE